MRGDPAAMPPPAGVVPWVSVDQMREVNRVMVEELGISLERMMENAGRSLAAVARGMLGGDLLGRRIVVLAGAGGNGGGGLAAARHLFNAGAHVDVRLATAAEAIHGVPGDQLAILRRMGLEARAAPGEPIGRPELVIDALLGYGQRGAPRGGIAGLVAATAGRRVLALDVPTGLDPDSGRPWNPVVRAETTLTLAAPKSGLGAASAHAFVGRLLLADITVPASVLRGVGADPGTPFARGPIVEVEPSSP